jgi:hypothetical protein
MKKTEGRKSRDTVPLNIGCGSVSSLDLYSMTLWIRIPDPDSEQENCKKKIYSKNLKLNVNVKHTLHYAIHTGMAGGRVSNLL